MQLATIVVVFLGLSCQQACAVQDTASPLPKVVGLLQNLQAQLKKDGEKEAKEVAEYQEWCRKGVDNLKYEIGQAKSDIEDEQATIAKASSDISTATSRIEDEAASTSETDGEIKKADGVRKKESADFKASEGELMDTIDTLERATNVLQRKMRGTALMEVKMNGKDIKELIDVMNQVVNAASLSLHDKKKLTALVQDSDEDEDDMSELGAPTAAAYKAHGGSILDMLEDLKQKAETQLTELRKEEKNTQHNFEMLRQSLVDQNAASGAEMGQAKEAKSLAAQSKAGAQGELAVSSKELEVSKNSLANMETGCMRVTDEFAASTQSRAEEAHAIDQALEALNGVPSFLQVQSNSEPFEVVNMLRNLAEQHHSSALTQLAGRVSTAMTLSVRRHDLDPFKNVRDMLTRMVEKLEKEGSGEASHKAYCDKEKKDSEAKKDELSFSLDKFAAAIDAVKAKAAGMKDEVSKAQSELATMANEQGEATKMRHEENAAYKTSKADLQKGMDGVRRAIKVLRKYFEQAPKDGALLQQPTPGHSAHQGTGDSVISILELVESDMSKELSALEMQEGEAAEVYARQTKDNNLARVTLEQSVKYKTKMGTSLSKTLTEKNSDMDAAQSEMDAVLEYAKSIKTQCDTKPTESYEDRSASREAEVAGLREALQSLGGETGFLQKNLRGVAKH